MSVAGFGIGSMFVVVDSDFMEFSSSLVQVFGVEWLLWILIFGIVVLGRGRVFCGSVRYLLVVEKE